MPSTQIIQIGTVTAGLLVGQSDSPRLTFQAADPRFHTLDGSMFANRHAAQRAVERVAAIQEVQSPTTTGDPAVWDKAS